VVFDIQKMHRVHSTLGKIVYPTSGHPLLPAMLNLDPNFQPTIFNLLQLLQFATKIYEALDSGLLATSEAVSEVLVLLASICAL